MLHLHEANQSHGGAILSGMIRWPIPPHTQLELVALIALRVLDQTLHGVSPIHSARVTVSGLSSAREVDVLFAQLPGRRTTVEAQKRGRRIGQQFVDAVEGKMPQVSADRTIMVSEAGFTEDAIRRVRSSGGRLAALTFERGAITVGNELAEASVELALVDGRRVAAALSVTRMADAASGIVLGTLLHGTNDALKALVIATVVDGAGGESGSVVVITRDLAECAVQSGQLRIAVAGRTVEETRFGDGREFLVPTGLVVR